MPAPQFATERTKRFRESTLTPFQEQKINDIERYGWQVLHVVGDVGNFSFSYTTGVFDTCGQPEIIEIGLRPKTSQYLLDEAAQRLRDGLGLFGRQTGVIKNVDCEFRPVDRKWAKRLMLGANWLYQETEYPALQAVYPDLKNRFPEDRDFTRFFAQPLLQPDAPFTEVEEKFWSYTESEPKH